MPATFYLTTAIAYTNAKPHIGFAMELIQSDCITRYYRMKLGTDNVYFLTGTDEHGMKMVETAAQEGITPLELVDRNSVFFQELTKTLNISNDDFIRTTEARHETGAIKLWNALFAAGDIYKDVYKGLYCVGCEAYILENDLIDGLCPNHKKPPKYFEEENYFFRFSKWIPQVKKLIESNKIQIIPESRKHEILNLLSEAEKEKRDVSFSRPRKALAWGIPVPNDPEQTMYVWCDALSNYITALDYEHKGKSYNAFWPGVHVIGKDILRFHAGFWPAMLLSANIPVPKAIYVHGYVTSEGQKMSKTLNNVVDPVEIVNRYGVDPVRYYLLREIPTTDDGDFSKTRFEILYNSELANNLGNLVNRVIAMTHKYFDGKIASQTLDGKIKTAVEAAWREYETNMEAFNIKAAAEAIVRFLTTLNQYVEEQKPWELAKKDMGRLAEVLATLIEGVRQAGLLLFPIIPASSEKIFAQLNVTLEAANKDRAFGGFFKKGCVIGKTMQLFPKLNS